MNTVSQTFNWSRFVATLRKELVENHRTILFSVICIYAMLTIIMIMINMNVNESVFMQGALKGLVSMVLMIIVCAMASLAFRNLKNKAGRTSLFMSPSSSLEKFLVNVIIYVIGLFVIYYACVQLADLTRIAVLKPFESRKLIVPGHIDYFLADRGARLYFWINLSNITGAIAFFSLYFLGSVLWPRLSVLKTFALFFVLMLSYILLLNKIKDVQGDEFFITGAVYKLQFAFYTVLAVVSFALSWILFKRKDVVSLKWWK